MRNLEKVNWRERAAKLCQTTRSRIDSVNELRNSAKKKLELSDEERDAPEEQARIKMIEDGVATVLDGSRAASSVNSDIKGGASRMAKTTKGEINRTTKKVSNPDFPYEVVQRK